MSVAAPVAPAALTARGVVKSFGGRRVLDGRDLDPGPRARVGLIGADGSGKSTLLRLPSGSDTPDAGTVTLAPRRGRRAPFADGRRRGAQRAPHDPRRAP